MLKLSVKITLFFFCLMMTGCTGTDPSESGTLRIVSLSHSITKEIIDLGAEDLLAGVTVPHPPLKKKVPVCGTLVMPDLEKIMLLKPDLILCSMEDSVTQKTDQLKAAGLPVYCFPENRDFDGICANYLQLGKLTGNKETAEKKLSLYRKKYEAASVKPGTVSVLLLLSGDPLITVSDSSFPGQMVISAGGRNLFGEAGRPYPAVSPEAVAVRNPDVVAVIFPGGEKNFEERFSGMGISAVEKNMVKYLDPEHAACYTPGDYAEAVMEMSMLIKQAAEAGKGSSVR